MEGVRRGIPAGSETLNRRPGRSFRQVAGTIKNTRGDGSPFYGIRKKPQKVSWCAGASLPAWLGRRGLVRACNTVPDGTD
jgi:hypothetical protein